jgi:hypothetical protein
MGAALSHDQSPIRSSDRNRDHRFQGLRGLADRKKIRRADRNYLLGLSSPSGSMAGPTGLTLLGRPARNYIAHKYQSTSIDSRAVKCAELITLNNVHQRVKTILDHLLIMTQLKTDEFMAPSYSVEYNSTEKENQQ